MYSASPSPTGLDLAEPRDEELERRIHALGTEILAEVAGPKTSLLDAQYYSDKFMDWAMKDEEVKISLFRFVDVLPNLSSSEAVVGHVQEYFEPLQGKIPEVLRKAIGISPTSLTAKIAAKAIRQQVRFVSQRFIVGETPKKALPALRKIRRRGCAFTVDLVGEATVSEAEARTYSERYLELLDELVRAVPSWTEAAPVIAGHRGEKTPINISVKLSALYSQSKPVSTEHSIGVFTERLAEIVRRAKQSGAFVYVDMEDCAMTTITLETFKRVLSLPELRDFDSCGIVLQAYLRRTPADVDELVRWVQRRGTPIGVRLVKGAYWDTETILAIQHGWPIPVWQEKVNSDATYEKLSRVLLENHQLIAPAFGSHNVRSLCTAIKTAELLGLSPEQFEIQTLYGMGDPIKEAFASRGLLVREYAPVGELIPGMGYLVRRLLENTSNEGFLRQSMHENQSPAVLLRKPEFDVRDSGTAHIDTVEKDVFYNASLRDFTLEVNRENFSGALEEWRRTLEKAPVPVEPIIGGAARKMSSRLESTSPERSSLVVADVGLAGRPEADEALSRLHAYFPRWRATPAAERVEILRRAAALLEERRDRFSAAIVLEAGKPWLEADADVAEAIDFLRYYSLEALALFSGKPIRSFAGERNVYFYEPRGITLVLCPWNFPLAIPCGMFAAALVTGNCAILKPAEQTSFVAGLLYELLLEAGLPVDAAAFLPGIGEEIGAYLADHPLVSTIVFTGSKNVGLHLIESGGKHHPQSEHVKRIIAEMGGKNAIIVDEDADLDEAVKGVVYSAFGYAGQKCSACSRAIVLAGCYDRFVERLAEAVMSLRVGPASDPSMFCGPVIDQEAFDRIARTIAETRTSCRVISEASLSEGVASQGHFIAPIVFGDIPANHPILSTEVFGPVLAVERASHFEEALDAALLSEYGLTGGIFSRSPRNIERAAERFRVGNLYINRGCTGALVLRQPFGGAKLSGVGSKAGGPDYLAQFVIPRTVTENTMRRGFAPLSSNYL